MLLSSTRWRPSSSPQAASPVLVVPQGVRRPEEAASDRVDLAGPASVPPPPALVHPNPTPYDPSLLAAMRPFIREVHVVQAGGANLPPILGGCGAGAPLPLPETLRSMPSQRWVMTPAIEASHRRNICSISNAELRAQDHFELEPTVPPLLQRRYGDRTDLTVIELGPATSTVVPRALGGKVGQYFATDLSIPLLERQRDLLNEPGYAIAQAYQVQGDTYNLPYEDGIADLLFTSCHPPFVSSSPGERIQAFAEVARVLKPGGELVLLPWDSSQQHPAVSAFVDKTFEMVERVDSNLSNLEARRQLVVLRKR